MSRPKLKIVQPADLPGLLGLLTEGFPTHSVAQWERRFKAWWLDNPFLGPDMPIGWALEDPQTGIAGFMGSIPVKFLVNGKSDIAVAASSWYVKPPFRGVHSLAFLLAFQRQRSPGLFLSTTPTIIVANILRQLGFASLEFPFQRKEYWIVLRLEEIVNRALRRYFKSGRLRPLLNLATPPFKALWQAYYHPKNKRLSQFQSSRYRCSLTPSCDDSFTELWERAERKESSTLYRDARTLNWLLSSGHTDGDRLLIQCTDTRENALKGYMLFDLDVPEGSSYPTMQLKDLFLPRLEEEALLSMLAYAMRLAREREVSLLKLWAAGEETDSLLRKHIRLQKTIDYPYFYKFGRHAGGSAGPKPPLVPSLLDPDRGLI